MGNFELFLRKHEWYAWKNTHHGTLKSTVFHIQLSKTIKTNAGPNRTNQQFCSSLINIQVHKNATENYAIIYDWIFEKIIPTAVRICWLQEQRVEIQ